VGVGSGEVICNLSPEMVLMPLRYYLKYKLLLWYALLAYQRVVAVV